MSYPDEPRLAHDLILLDGGALCARCRRFEYGMDVIGGGCQPRHLPARLLTGVFADGRAACGAPGDFGHIANRAIDCGACLKAALGTGRQPPAHDLRLWGEAALCVSCGAFSSAPSLLPACQPLPPRERPECLAREPESAGAVPTWCGTDPPVRPLNVRQPEPSDWGYLATRMRSWRTFARADCRPCLDAAAAALPPYRRSHDLRLSGGGVCCPDCGLLAASPPDAPCDGGYALAVMDRRAAEPLVRTRTAGQTLLWIGLPPFHHRTHAPGGCGREAGSRIENVLAGKDAWPDRVTCKNCLKRLAKAPRLPGLAAHAHA